jgi:transcriptional regulator with XRE-family HTH domain
MSIKHPERFEWDAERVRSLRRHLGLTQRQFADEINTEQQRISEWETGVHQPSRLTATLLSMVAERSGFDTYSGPAKPAADDGMTLEEFRHRPVDEVGLRPRAIAALKQADLTEVGQVLDLLSEGDGELLAIPDFGRRSLTELKARLAERGLQY